MSVWTHRPFPKCKDCMSCIYDEEREVYECTKLVTNETNCPKNKWVAAMFAAFPITKEYYEVLKAIDAPCLLADPALQKCIETYEWFERWRPTILEQKAQERRKPNMISRRGVKC